MTLRNSKILLMDLATLPFEHRPIVSSIEDQATIKRLFLLGMVELCPYFKRGEHTFYRVCLSEKGERTLIEQVRELPEKNVEYF